MTEFTFKLIFLSIPGILAYFIINRLTSGLNDDNTVNKILKIFLLSVISYSFYGIVESIRNLICGREFTSTIFDDLMSSQSLQLIDITGGTIIAIILGFALSFSKNKNFLHRFAQYCNISNKFGDNDVWTFFLNADLEKAEETNNSDDSESSNKWVFIRDLKERLLYYGYISVWSESHSVRELVVSDVEVYDNDSTELLYKTDHVYLSRNSDDLIIEIPNFETLKEE